MARTSERPDLRFKLEAFADGIVTDGKPAGAR
jgi:hypothetical protein